MKQATEINNVSNDAESTIIAPYLAEVEVVGTAALLFHRWSVDGVEAKSKAAKGSRVKKEDDVESYVYRDDKGMLGIPGEYFRMAIVNAAKYRQDPRSPRKSAMDLTKAGVVAMTPVCSLGVKDWNFIDRRRVMIQRNGITRCRPAMHEGWTCKFLLQVLLPEYIPAPMLNDLIQQAGRLIGVGDFRPTFGRFQVVKFEVE